MATENKQPRKKKNTLTVYHSYKIYDFVRLYIVQYSIAAAGLQADEEEEDLCDLHPEAARSSGAPPVHRHHRQDQQ